MLYMVNYGTDVIGIIVGKMSASNVNLVGTRRYSSQLSLLFSHVFNILQYFFQYFL